MSTPSPVLQELTRLALLESELSRHRKEFQEHESKDDERFTKVTESLIRIERIMWAALVVIAAVNGPTTLKALGLFGG